MRRKWEETYTLFDKVIILGTKECRDNTIGEMFEKAIEENKNSSGNLIENMKKAEPFLKMTTLQYYKNVITHYMRKLETEEAEAEAEVCTGLETENIDNDMFIFLDVDDLNISQMSEELQKLSDPEDDANIYMDYTGGTRVTSLIAMMICRWLEVKNYTMRCVVYCDINNRANAIRDITDEYRLINGVIAFDKQNDPDLEHVSAENRDLSVAYGLKEYREKRPDYIPADKSDQPFIFLSYAHLDFSPCQAILQKLKYWGYRVWYDEGIGWGDYWEKTLRDHMNQCQMAIVLLSENYLKRDYCIKELDALAGKKKYIIWLGNVSPGPEFLEKYPFLAETQGLVRLKNNRRYFYKKVSESLQKIEEAAPTKGSAPA